MVVIRNIKPEFVSKNRLLAIYIPLILDHNKSNLSPEEIQQHLIKDFNHSVSLEKILDYLEPNFYEIRADIEQQMINLGIRYD